MLKYYVYELVNSLTGNVFYLGKGSGGRIDQHEKDARKPGSTYKLNKIRSIWRKGGKVIKRKVGLFVNESDALEYEAQLIRTTPGLTNIRLGEIRPEDTKMGRRLYCAAMIYNIDKFTGSVYLHKLYSEGAEYIQLLRQDAYMKCNF